MGRTTPATRSRAEVTATATRPSSMRSFGQVSKWWAAKIAPLLAVAYLALLIAPLPAGEAAIRLGTLLVSACLLATAAYVVNDFYDREEDLAAGHSSAVTRLRTHQVVWILVGLVGAGLAPWLFVPIPVLGWVALGVIALLPFVYSAPPLRWKERGALGLLADAALAHVAPTVFAFAAFDCFGGAGTSGRPEVTILLGAVVSWSAWTGLRAIVGHEITDGERDREAGLTTWVVSVGERRARSLVTRYLLPLEVLSLAVAWAALIPIDSFAAWSFALITAGLALGRLTGAFPAPLHAVPSSDEPARRPADVLPVLARGRAGGRTRHARSRSRLDPRRPLRALLPGRARRGPQLRHRGVRDHDQLLEPPALPVVVVVPRSMLAPRSQLDPLSTPRAPPDHAGEVAIRGCSGGTAARPTQALRPFWAASNPAMMPPSGDRSVASPSR